MAPSITGDLRIVLLGMTGAGKSATGNTILGEEKDAFKVDFNPVSITQQSEKKVTRKGNRSIFIIDTPGLQDTTEHKNRVKAEIKKCMKMAAPGPHVFLLVIRVDVRLTEEVINTVKWIQQNFGEDAARHTIIVFTYTDQLKSKPLQDHIEESPDLRQFVMTCGGRYHGFNNEDRENQTQVNELLDKMDGLVLANRGGHYTNEMFNKAQCKLNHVKTVVTVVAVVTVGVVVGALVVAVLKK